MALAKAAASAGVVFIFQLATISTFRTRGIIPCHPP
jgi:hypothetical protein